jgi:hypothetical protein
MVVAVKGGVGRWRTNIANVRTSRSVRGTPVSILRNSVSRIVHVQMVQIALHFVACRVA